MSFFKAQSENTETKLDLGFNSASLWAIQVKCQPQEVIIKIKKKINKSSLIKLSMSPFYLKRVGIYFAFSDNYFLHFASVLW